jgi:glycosyltransferase involved in cell wall biosynthesis
VIEKRGSLLRRIGTLKLAPRTAPGARTGRTGRAPRGRGSLSIAMVAACPFPCRRGTPIRIQREAEALAARGHDVHVVTYFLGTPDPLERVSVHRTARLPFYRTTSPGPTYGKLLMLDPLLAVQLAWVIHREQIDVIHAHHYEGLLAALAARPFARRPLVYDAHTTLSSELPYFRMRLPRRLVTSLGASLDRRLPGFADHVISVTETIRAQLIRDSGCDPAQVTMIANGVEADRFRPQVQPSWAPEVQKRIVFTGNLAPYQGVDLLLEAFAEVARRRSDVRLMIVTESAFADYETMARRLGIRDHIEILPAPSFDRLPALLEGAHIAANPRVEAEGMPLKLLNYMAAAKPIVSFKGSAPGLTHGQTAWFAADNGPSAFAQGILALLDDPEAAQELGRRARRLVEERHRWPVVAEQIERVYRDILEPA